jgi:hypothetical protein
MNQGKIVVRLVRDHKHRLIGIREIDIIHYSLQLTIENLPETEKPEKVVYCLDSSYASPKIVVKGGTPKFLTEITTYGDYDLKAELHYLDRVEILVTSIYGALYELYKDDTATEIKQALEQIKRL